MKAAHRYVVECVLALPPIEVLWWFLKLVPPLAFTTVARPLFALVLLLEGTGGGILVLPKGEHAGRLLLWVEEEEEDGGGEETEAETVLAVVEEAALALEDETVLEVVEEEETVFGVEEEAVLVLEEEEWFLTDEGGEFSRFPKS